MQGCNRHVCREALHHPPWPSSLSSIYTRTQIQHPHPPPSLPNHNNSNLLSSFPFFYPQLSSAQIMPPPSPGPSVVDDEINNNNNNNNNENWSSFQNFFQGWLIRQQNCLNQLITAQINIQNRTHDELNNLSSQVLSHYQQYYQAKSIVSHNDVFIMFAPPWFSSLEHTFLWITGFKPCLAFKILTNSVTDLSRDQLHSIQRLRAETGASEKELSDEMARIQESLASPPLLDLARKMGTSEQQQQQQEEDMRNVEAAIQSLREAMESLVDTADFIRMNTSRKIVEILSPVQSVKFLAAATKLQVRIRSLGLQRDAERRRRRRSGRGGIIS